MKFDFTVTSNLQLRLEDGKSVLDEVKYKLSCGPHVDPSMYIQQDGQPNQDGIKVISQVMIMTLASNIHAAHQLGQRDSAEHLRWAIGELERAFAEVCWVDLNQTM